MSKKVLLIEDNAEMRENTAEILQLAHYKVIAAMNGKEGVELAEKEEPDLIICDIMMPVLDGYGVLHMLSKNEKTASIPFIFLTALLNWGRKREIHQELHLKSDRQLYPGALQTQIPR